MDKIYLRQFRIKKKWHVFDGALCMIFKKIIIVETAGQDYYEFYFFLQLCIYICHGCYVWTW